jgi:hypothetical protein
MNLIEVQSHEQCVLVSVVARSASRLSEAERLVERNGLHVGGAYLEVGVACIGIGVERGADQGAGVSTPAILGLYGDGGYVQLAEDVADPDLANDLASLFEHQVESVGTPELSAPDRRAPGTGEGQSVYFHNGGEISGLHPAQVRSSLAQGWLQGLRSRRTSASGSRT